ncbi:MAG: hypothetical protein RLW68_00960 [Devosia marina]|uniref:hypothetical protein n=1 Tax=Devosia marina TaxID=2683198 RepID=UPI0032EB60F0
MSNTAKLLSDVEAFLAKTDMSASYFGKMAANDSNFVARLRNGTTPVRGREVFVRPDTERAVRTFMRKRLAEKVSA